MAFTLKRYAQKKKIYIYIHCTQIIILFVCYFKRSYIRKSIINSLHASNLLKIYFES